MNNLDSEESQLILQENNRKYNFFSCFCFKSVVTYYFVLFVSMLTSIIFAIYTNGILFIILSAIIPGALIVEYARNFYDEYVTRCQMTVTFVETIIYLNFINIITKFLQDILISSNQLSNIFITSFILAGLMEETTKFLPLYRIINQTYITDPRALWVYGICAGAGFACFENIFYVLSGGIDTAIVRSILSVPLHCCTGLIIGINMSVYKFKDKLSVNGCSKLKYFKSIILPIIIHGLFDFILMIGEDIDSPIFSILVVIELILTFIFIRTLLIKLDYQFNKTESIHQMIEETRLSPPCAWFIH